MRERENGIKSKKNKHQQKQAMLKLRSYLNVFIELNGKNDIKRRSGSGTVEINNFSSNICLNNFLSRIFICSSDFIFHIKSTYAQAFTICFSSLFYIRTLHFKVIL